MMSNMFDIVFVCGFVTGFLPTWLGLLLINNKPEIKKLVVVGICYAILAILFRSTHMNMWIQFFGLTALLIFINMMVFNLNILRAIIVTVLGTLVMLIGESFFTPMTMNLAKLQFEQMINSHYYALYLGLPQIIMTVILIFICNRFNFHLFNFQNGKEEEYSLSGKHRSRLIGIFIIFIVVILVQTICNYTVFSLSPSKSISILPVTTIGLISNASIIFACLAVGFLIKQLISLTAREQNYQMQTEYINTLNELFTAVREQRHDIINHLHTLYGFVQMGNMESVRGYLEDVMGESLFSHRFMISDHPGLSSLLFIKTGLAASHGIVLEFNIGSSLKDIGVQPYELNRVVGNLINNAIDYEKNLDRSDRLIRIGITENAQEYVFKIANRGHIDDAVLTSIFARGFSTKGESHGGLGLNIVYNLVHRNKGSIKVENIEGFVVFTIILPRVPAIVENNELLEASI